jgi:hypothetical protein
MATGTEISFRTPESVGGVLLVEAECDERWETAV